MKNRSAIGTGFLPLLLCAFLVLAATGCSKHEDDCSAPKENETEVTTRSFAADQSNDIDIETKKRPSSSTFRGAESAIDDPDGDGISDDGDDEADGEGNKKNRPGH